MSTLNLKNIQLGDNPDPSKNFVLSVPAVADGTLSIKRQDGTNVLSIEANGKAVIPGVVGTVAQVGGIPTGQVVERGSNANGEYVRFADGTQICTTVANTPAWSGASNVSVAWNYPAVFALVHALSTNIVSALPSLFNSSAAGGGATSATLYAGGTTSGNAAQLLAVAVGRWF